MTAWKLPREAGVRVLGRTFFFLYLPRNRSSFLEDPLMMAPCGRRCPSKKESAQDGTRSQRRRFRTAAITSYWPGNGIADIFADSRAPVYEIRDRDLLLWCNHADIYVLFGDPRDRRPMCHQGPGKTQIRGIRAVHQSHRGWYNPADEHPETSTIGDHKEVVPIPSGDCVELASGPRATQRQHAQI